MALGTKFQVVGTSDVYGRVTVNIKLEGYTGSVISLDGVGRDWINLKIGDNSSEISSPILAGKLSFSFYVNTDFQTTEIGKAEPFTYYVETLDSSNQLIWAGWAMPEEYSEAYQNTPYVATVSASDGLDELKNVNYPLLDGKATLFTHLRNALVGTFVTNKFFESVNIYSNGMNSTASDSPLTQAQVTYNSFRSISETPKAYEVLSSLLVPFFCRIYQYRGWRIENILEKRSSYIVREYNSSGVYVGQSTFNPLVRFDTDYSTFKAFIQKSGQLSIRPALNNAEVYFNTIEPIEPTTTGGFQEASDWVSTTELDQWNVVAGGGANEISIEQVPSSFDGNEFAVKIPGRKTSLELTDYIESDPVNIATADYESINVDFAHYANYPAVVILGSKPILYFEIVFTETSSGDVYNWNGSEWVLIPLGQTRRRLRIDFNDRMKWRRYSAVIDRVPSTGNIKFRFYKLIKSGSVGVTELRLTAWKTNLIISQPTNAALLLEAGSTNVFTQYKGPSFPHIISDGTVLNAAGVIDVSNVLTATWARRGVTESLNIRRLFLTQWLSFNSRPTEILSGTIHQKGEVITPMSVVKDKDAVSSVRYVMQSYELSLGTGIGSASYREIVMEDANINAFQDFVDSIRLGDFFATTVNYNIFIGGAPGLSPGANPGLIDLNMNLNGDVRGGFNQAEITPAAIQNKARLDLTGLTADDIVLGAVKDSPDQENMTNLRLSDIKPLVSTPVAIGSPANGLSISGTQVLSLGLASAGVTGALSGTDWSTFNGKLNLTSPITGYTVGANTALAATDTILQAFGKVQGQINARISGTIASGQVAFGTGVNTVGGAGLTWDNALNSLTSTNAATFLITTVNQNLGIITTGNGNVNIIPNGTGNIGLKVGAQLNSVVTVNGDLGSGIRSNALSFSSARWFNIWHQGGSPRIGIFLEGNTATNTMKWTHPSLRANYLSFSSDFLDFNYTSLSTGIGNDITGLATLIRFDYANQRLGVNTTSPTNTLDVNGTTRIRTISNLGTAATSVLVPSATGVVSLRTLAELSADMGVLTGSGLTTNRFIKATSATTVGNTGVTEESAISYLFGTRTSLGNTTPLKVSFGATFGTNAVGSTGNLKWQLYDDGISANAYGIGMSAGMMELRSGASAVIGFFVNNGVDAFRLLSTTNAYFTSDSISFGTNTITSNRLTHKSKTASIVTQFLLEDISGNSNFSVSTSGIVNLRSNLIAVGDIVTGNATGANGFGGLFLKGNNDGIRSIQIQSSTGVVGAYYQWTQGFNLVSRDSATNVLSTFLSDGTTRIFTINGNGNVIFGDARNITFDVTTGTKIGTATNQRIGFFNATPIVQPSGDILTALSNLGLIATPTITPIDQLAVKTTASADQTLPSGTLTILDYDTTVINNSTPTYTVATNGRITINTTGIYTITAGVVVEANAVTALESAFLGIFRNGDLVAISSINTTIAAGAQSGLTTSTILSLTATDIIDCRALVNSVGGVANGLARRLGTLLGANATQVNSLSITKNSQ